MTRSTVPERCNALGFWYYQSGMRLCLAHSLETRETPSGRTFHAITGIVTALQPCDYPMDGLGAARLGA